MHELNIPEGQHSTFEDKAEALPSLADTILPYIGHERSVTANVEAAVPAPQYVDIPDVWTGDQIQLSPEQQQSLNERMRHIAQEQGYAFSENPDGTMTLVPPSAHAPGTVVGEASDQPLKPGVKEAARRFIPNGANALLALTAGFAASGLGVRNAEGFYNPEWLQREFDKADRRPKPTPEQIAEREKTAEEIQAHNAKIETERSQAKLMRKATKVMNKERAKQGLRKVT